jgi:hypothetical protein
MCNRRFNYETFGREFNAVRGLWFVGYGWVSGNTRASVGGRARGQVVMGATPNKQQTTSNKPPRFPCHSFAGRKSGLRQGKDPLGSLILGRAEIHETAIVAGAWGYHANDVERNLVPM